MDDPEGHEVRQSHLSCPAKAGAGCSVRGFGMSRDFDRRCPECHTLIEAGEVTVPALSPSELPSHIIIEGEAPCGCHIERHATWRDEVLVGPLWKSLWNHFRYGWSWCDSGFASRAPRGDARRGSRIRLQRSVPRPLSPGMKGDSDVLRDLPGRPRTRSFPAAGRGHVGASKGLDLARRARSTAIPGPNLRRATVFLTWHPWHKDRRLERSNSAPPSCISTM